MNFVLFDALSLAYNTNCPKSPKNSSLNVEQVPARCSILHQVQVEAPATPFSAKDHCANYCNNQGLISTAAWLADPQQRCSPLVSSKVTRPTTAFICRCEVDNAFRWFSGL